MSEDIQTGCINSLEDQRLLTTPRIIRVFHPTTVTDIATGKFTSTHAKVVANVLFVRSETDGDIHIRLVEGTNFIVGEIIPELPKPKPLAGSTITVWGITRYDAVHKWWEIHPILGWSTMTILGAIADVSALTEVPTAETDEADDSE